MPVIYSRVSLMVNMRPQSDRYLICLDAPSRGHPRSEPAARRPFLTADLPPALDALAMARNDTAVRFIL